MSKIPDPVRPAPRRRNTFEQAAQSISTETVAAPQTTSAPDALATPPSATATPPATPVPTVATPPATPEPTVATPPAAEAQAPRPIARDVAPVEKKRKRDTMDILLSVPEDLKQRMVATLEHTRPRTGITSQQQFIRTAIEQLCKRLEHELNNGDQFPAPAEKITL